MKSRHTSTQFTIKPWSKHTLYDSAKAGTLGFELTKQCIKRQGKEIWKEFNIWVMEIVGWTVKTGILHEMI